MKKILMAMLMMISATTLWTGCETSEGMGRDVENLGNEIEEI